MRVPGCTNRVPPSGSTNPAIILSKVDFPEPLRPTRAMRSDFPISTLKPLNNGGEMKAATTSVKDKIGGATKSPYVVKSNSVG